MNNDGQTASPVGLVVASATPPEDVPQFAATAEQLGFGELWMPEDYFFNGGVASAVAALGATNTIPVGLGVVSAMARHPAALAMEIATIERLYPGRLRPGIGLGVPHWVRQMGLMPKSQLAALRETVTGVKRLLRGEEVTEEGQVHSFHQVKLTHPLEKQPPVYMGVVGPKMLRLSGEVADATVVSVLAGTTYVRWLRERIAEGQKAAGREGESHRVATFVLYSVDDDAARAREAMRATAAFYLAAMPKSALTDVYGIGDELMDMYQRGAAEAPSMITQEMPESWIDDLCVAGTPDQVAEKIQALIDAGSDSVCLCPIPPERSEEMLELTARRVLPAVSARTVAA
jgi:5,10-methylenetetrahydromethanopterin reductase